MLELSNCRREVSDKFCVEGRFTIPFSPYGIQKRPEPQICPKFVPDLLKGVLDNCGFFVEFLFCQSGGFGTLWAGPVWGFLKRG